MTQASQSEFQVMTDEHIPNAIADQLSEKGVSVVRLIDVLPTGTSDPDVLEFCHQNGYALVTLDERIKGHIADRTKSGREHAGVFIGTRMQGASGIGLIVSFIVFYNQSITAGAATVEEDVYNQIIYIR